MTAGTRIVVVESRNGVKPQQPPNLGQLRINPSA